jgi:hypothetical protein
MAYPPECCGVRTAGHTPAVFVPEGSNSQRYSTPSSSWSLRFGSKPELMAFVDCEDGVGTGYCGAERNNQGRRRRALATALQKTSEAESQRRQHGRLGKLP